MIRAVALDLMDTVVRDPFREALEEATGLELAELFARRDPDVYPAFERGEVDEAAYWAHYEDAGIDVDPVTFHEVRREGIALLPGMGELLDELDQVVVRATASNYPTWVDELVATHLAGRIDVVVASCHLGVRKPDLGFYRGLLDRLRSTAGEVLFVDDREVNVEAAAALGMRAHRFVDVTTLRRWFAEQGLPVAARTG